MFLFNSALSHLINKQHQTHLKVKRENSQVLKMYKMEKNKWKTILLKDTIEKIILPHQKSLW